MAIDVSASGSASAAGESTGDGGGGGDANFVLSLHKKLKVVSMNESTTALTEKEIEEQKDNIQSSSHNETEKSEEISLGEGEIDESLQQEPEEEEEVDIITVSDEETALAEGGRAERSLEIEKQESSSSEDQESSESDGSDEETEPEIFQNLPPEFPSRFAKLIEDPASIRPRILMEKRLNSANIDESRNRLPISPKTMKEVFLLPEEEAELESGKEIEVTVIEPDGVTVSRLTLRLRTRRPTYVLTKTWKDVVARNSDALKKGEFVRVWYFRVNGGELWFAIDVEDGKHDREIVKHVCEEPCGQNALPRNNFFHFFN